MRGQEVFEHIAEDACRALEAIVGPEHITTDPIVCEAYTGRGFDREFLWFQGVSRTPSGIILPETTEQVARIVRTCNRYGVPYTPMSTYGMAFSAPSFRNDIIIIDLKRMNKMWLDEKNMYAIVEPAVSYAQLHGEILKRGLIACMPGGGGGVSVLANTFVNGMGLFNYRINFSSQRRLNGVEWVTPEGEIYRFGSLVEGDDSWYWQDGLGPNVIGLLHGITCWGGAMGIVTRISTKLYPFQPQKLEPDGVGPNTCVKMPTDRVRWYNIGFPTEESLEKAIHEMGRSRIGYVINRIPAYWRDIAKSRGDLAFRNEFWGLWNQKTPEKVAERCVVRICLVGRASQRQLEYEERVLTDIVNENGGTLLRTRQVDEASFFAANSPGMWKATGLFGEGDGGMESLSCNHATRESYIKRLKEYNYKSDFLDQKEESPWYMPFVLGRVYYTELHGWPDAAKVDPDDPEFQPELVRRIIRWRLSEAEKIIIQTGNQSFFGTLVQPVRPFTPAFHNYHLWLDRFKKEFDPKGLSAPGQPFIIDRMIAELYPEAITDELKETVKKAEAGPWMGNPES